MPRVATDAGTPEAAAPALAPAPPTAAAPPLPLLLLLPSRVFNERSKLSCVFSVQIHVCQ